MAIDDECYRFAPAAPPAATRLLNVCCARLHCIPHCIFADRAGAGRRSGSGRGQGRVRRGRPLLSRPRGAVGSGAAAVQSAADSVVALSTCRAGDVGGLGGSWMVEGCEVLLLADENRHHRPLS